MECSLHHNFQRTLIFTLSHFGADQCVSWWYNHIFSAISPHRCVVCCMCGDRVSARTHTVTSLPNVFVARILIFFCAQIMSLKRWALLFLTYYGLWLICFMHFMSANNTLNCFMFYAVHRSIDRLLLYRANDKKSTHFGCWCCYVDAMFNFNFYFSSHMLCLKPQSHGKSSNFTFYKGTATIFNSSVS